MTIKTINSQTIRLDGETQSRVAIDNDVVAEYSDAIQAGDKFAPVIVYFDGADNWLADGFHRVHANNAAGKTSIEADVRTGTLRDAILYSLGANKQHGLRPSNDDKRKSVARMLADPEWSQLSDRDIARHCGCSRMTVGRLRNPEPVAHKAAASVTSDTAAKKPAAQPVALAPAQPAAPVAQTAAQLEAAQIAEDAHGGIDIEEELATSYKVNEDLRAQIEVANADEPKAEAMKWKRIADVARNRQNELQVTVNEREEDIKRLQKSLRRIGAAVGEDDPTKIAATVEAFVRNMGKVEA